MAEKIKVVWLCHFSNARIRELYPTDSSRKLYYFVRKILHLPHKNGSSNDFAPWVSGGIREMQKHDDIELHVISPQTDMKGRIYEFEDNGVFYHFYNPNWSLLLMHLIKHNARLWLKLQNSSRYALRFIKQIKPDIVNLLGTENTYHSCAALYVPQNIPMMVSLQTMYSNPDRLKHKNNFGIDKSVKWKVDVMIQQKFKFFGVMGIMHRDWLLKHNPGAIPLAFSFCGDALPEVNPVDKEYDFVNFAMGHTITKGSYDSLKALALVKKKYPTVTLNYVGNISDEVMNDFREIIEKEDLKDNVIFTPFFKERKDMFQHLQKSRFAVLPVYFDNVSGTTIQAMHYGLPTITNVTSGTPFLNVGGERVLLSEIGNVEMLAEKMISLMDNPDLCERLKSSAKEYVDTLSDNTRINDRLVEDYKAIVNYYKNGNPIPAELLFNENNPLI